MAVVDPDTGVMIPDWDGYPRPGGAPGQSATPWWDGGQRSVDPFTPGFENPSGPTNDYSGGALPLRPMAPNAPSFGAPNGVSPQPYRTAPSQLNLGNSWIGSKLSNPLVQLGLGIAGPQFAQGGRMAMGAAQNERDIQGLRDAHAGALAMGATPEQAQMLAMNPQAFKLTQPHYDKIQSGMFGEQTPYSVSPFTGKASPIDMSAVGGGAGGGGGSMSSIVGRIGDLGPDATREQRLAQVPAEGRGLVQALIEGREMPQLWGRMGQTGKAGFFAIAQAVDPNFDATKLYERQAFVRQEANTNVASYGGQVASAGTIIDHISKAQNSLAALNAHLQQQTGFGGLPGPQINHEILSGYRNAADIALIRNGSDQKAKNLLAEYERESKAATNETERLVTGGHGAWAERKGYQEELNLRDNSLSSIAGTFEGLEKVMLGRLESMAAHKSRAFGGEHTAESLLHPNAQNQMTNARGVRGNNFASEAGPKGMPPAGKLEAGKTIRDGYMYMGGPPGDPKSWKKVR